MASLAQGSCGALSGCAKTISLCLCLSLYLRLPLSTAPDLDSVTTCLLSMAIWMSNRHLDPNMSKNKSLGCHLGKLQK